MLALGPEVNNDNQEFVLWSYNGIIGPGFMPDTRG